MKQNIFEISGMGAYGMKILEEQLNRNKNVIIVDPKVELSKENTLILGKAGSGKN